MQTGRDRSFQSCWDTPRRNDRDDGIKIEFKNHVHVSVISLFQSLHYTSFYISNILSSHWKAGNTSPKYFPTLNKLYNLPYFLIHKYFFFSWTYIEGHISPFNYIYLSIRWQSTFEVEFHRIEQCLISCSLYRVVINSWFWGRHMNAISRIMSYFCPWTMNLKKQLVVCFYIINNTQIRSFYVHKVGCKNLLVILNL